MLDVGKDAEESPEISSLPPTPVTDVEKEPGGKGRGILLYLCKMLSDLLLIGFISLSAFSYVQNANEPLIRAARKPSPFFPEKSLVRDYFTGDVFWAFKDAGHYEGSFFLFYAPWDRESQEARRHLDTVATFFSGSDVMVAGVNCWYPASDCAKEFGGKGGSGHILPVLIYYPKLLSGIQYRGILDSEHIIRFVQECRYSLTHLQSYQHFQQLQVENDNVLVGYLPATTTVSLDQNHEELRRTALSLLEVLPEKRSAVGVVTSPQLAKQMHLHATQPVRLFTANATHVFPNKTVDHEKLLVWTLQHIPSSPAWLTLSGKKSLILKKVLEGGTGSTLLVFSPRAPALRGDKIYSMIRQVSADYYNCDNSPTVDNLVTRLQNYNAAPAQSCRSSQQQPGRSSDESVITSSSSFCNLRRLSYEKDNFPACSPSCHASNSSACQDSVLREHLNYYDANVGLMLEGVNTEIKYSKQFAGSEPAVQRYEEPGPVISGLGCNNNRTLRMYRVDSEEYLTLLTKLGLESKALPLPLIINTAEESVYLPNSFREDRFVPDMKRLLVDWHEGRLTGKPGYRSTKDRYPVSKGSDSSVIHEISAATFFEATSSNNDVVLFYTSRFCTHCTAASYVFHSVQLYLQNLHNVRFMQVDAADNDLNWEFTALTYPTVLFFPKHRSAESRVFPSHQPLNLINLLSFVVANLKPVPRLQLALQHCDLPCKQKLRVLAGHRVSELTGELRRRGSRLPATRRRSISRRLNYAKSVLYLLASSMTESDQGPTDFQDTIVENFLRENF